MKIKNTMKASFEEKIQKRVDFIHPFIMYIHNCVDVFSTTAGCTQTRALEQGMLYG